MKKLKYIIFPWREHIDKIDGLKNEANGVLYKGRSVTTNAAVRDLNRQLKNIHDDMQKELHKMEAKTFSNKSNYFLWGLWWFNISQSIGMLIVEQNMFWTRGIVIFCAVFFLIHVGMNIFKNEKKKEEFFLEQI